LTMTSKKTTNSRKAKGNKRKPITEIPSLRYYKIDGIYRYVWVWRENGQIRKSLQKPKAPKPPSRKSKGSKAGKSSRKRPKALPRLQVEDDWDIEQVTINKSEKGIKLNIKAINDDPVDMPKKILDPPKQEDIENMTRLKNWQRIKDDKKLHDSLENVIDSSSKASKAILVINKEDLII